MDLFTDSRFTEQRLDQQGYTNHRDRHTSHSHQDYHNFADPDVLQEDEHLLVNELPYSFDQLLKPVVP